MAENRKNSGDLSDRALEMIMRDVLNSMEECLLETAYSHSREAGFEIIDISPPESMANHRREEVGSTEAEGVEDAEVISFPIKNRVYG